MEDMFDGATSFNQPLEKWDVSKVTDMEDMFRYATSFTHQAPKRNSSAEEGFKSKVSSIKDFCTKLKQLEDNGTETDEILNLDDNHAISKGYEGNLDIYQYQGLPPSGFLNKVDKAGNIKVKLELEIR
jgi:surface protein